MTEVHGAIHSGDAGAREIGEIISSDAGFASHVLKVVNSAYYSLPVEVSNIRFAIAYLGLGEISRITLTLSVIQSLSPKDKDVLREFWIHSYHTALATKPLFKQLAYAIDNAEDLYASALLHDIGKLIYAKFFPEHFETMSRHCLENGCLFSDAERHFEMPSHGMLGELLCDHWKLPERIKRACVHHELDDLKNLDNKNTGDPFDVLLSASNALSHLSVGFLNEQLKDEIADEIQRLMELSHDHFLMLMGDIYELRLKAEQSIEQLL